MSNVHPAVQAVRDFNRESDAIERQIVALTKKLDAGAITYEELKRRAALVLMTEDQASKLRSLGVLDGEIVRIDENLELMVQVGGMRVFLGPDGDLKGVQVNGHARESLRRFLNAAKKD